MSNQDPFAVAVRKEYGAAIADQFLSEVNAQNGEQASETTLLAKILARHSTRVASATEAFTSLPVPMRFDIKKRRSL